ncbi:hypothetical protein DFJ73DRAFT_856781 [Zopfochytrium polystomum]|nr:hypothetical protein DFJ73DRAFT_856781 [Zopfochytrium polystomum]
MSEIEEFDDQIQELIQGIRQVVEKELPKLKGQERIERCAYLRNRLNRAKQLHRSILVEIRDLPEEKVHDWQAKAREYETTIGRLVQDVEWAETSAKGTPGEGAGGKKEVDEMTPKELTTQALKVQQETQEATSRTKRIVEQTIEIGSAVNDELRKQGEQIHNIADGVDQVESNLKRADKQLRVFMRRMSSDKIFLVMIFCVCVGIIIAIILYILKKKTGMLG